MTSSLIVLLIAAALTGGAALWVLRAYRRADDKAKPAPALLACAAAGIAALALYVVVGRPDLPGASFAARFEALKQRDPTTFNADEALAVLARAARDNPSDPTPLVFSGDVLFQTGRDEEAARAYDAALRRDPASAQAALGLGRTLVRIEQRLTPDAVAMFERAAAADAADPTPWIYLATAAMEEDRAADASRLWGEALARMDEDDPRRSMAQRMTETGR
ncbi:MAG: tetratricopeptide repeat protein [Hyphomonadaceae bacterium]